MPSALTDNGSTRKWRSLRKRVLTRDRWTCQWCGGPADTVGHIVPRRHGGGDELTNLAAQCRECQRQERPLPSAMHNLAGASGMHKPALRSAYPSRSVPRGQAATDAPGQTVGKQGHPSDAVAVSGVLGHPRAAGEALRRRSVFYESGLSDMRLSAISTHKARIMHSMAPSMQVHNRVVTGDYSRRKPDDGAA